MKNFEKKIDFKNFFASISKKLPLNIQKQNTYSKNKTKDWALVHERELLVFLIRNLYMV